MPQDSELSPNDSPLYRELLAIGSKDRSLGPAVLGKHKNLLASAEVVRRVGSNSDPRQLALRASQALRAAIRTLPKGSRRTVVEAALCATKPYEHTNVEQRKQQLEGKGISRDMFRYHRKEGFGEIIQYLSRSAISNNQVEQAVQSYRPRRHNLTRDEWIALEISRFARLATDLHYACLATLFDKDLSYHLMRNGILPKQLISTQFGKNLLRDYVFQSYTAMLYWPGLPRLQEQITSPSRKGRTIAVLLETIGDATPLGPRSLPKNDMLKTAVVAVPESETLQWKRLRLAQDAYSSHWRPWFYEHCEIRPSTSLDSILVPIAAASGAIERALTAHYKIASSSLHKPARLAAYKTLAQHYEKIDDTLSLAGGLPLRQRADAYFDVLSALLTMSADSRIVDKDAIGSERSK